MKFICQSCTREFEFGAPKGMQLPCPACGGMLVDEETAAGAPSPSAPPPSPPRPAAAAFAPAAGGAAPAPSAPEAPMEDISLEAAEAFLQQAGQGGTAPAAAVPGAAAQPAQVPSQEQWPAQAPSQEQLPAQAPSAEQWPAQVPSAEQLPAQAPSAEQWPAVEQGLQPQAGAEVGYPEGGPEQQPVGPDGLPLEEEPEERGASPLILTLGWVLFGICVVGLAVMGYFLKQMYDKLQEAGDPTAMRQMISRLKKESDEQRNRANEMKKQLDEAIAKAAEAVEEKASLKVRAERAEEAEKKKTEEARRLTAELADSRDAFSAAEADSTSLRDVKEKARAEAAKARGRLAAGRQALRAIDLMNRPSRWKEALSYLDSAVRSAEDFGEARWLRARLLAKLHRAEEALRDFDRVDQLTRSENAAGHVRALVAAGDVCRTQLDDRERAIRYYRRASEAAPDSPFAKLAEARLRVMSGRSESGRRNAEAAAREAEKGGEDWVQLRLLVAEAKAESPGDRSQVIKEIGEVITADPDNVAALDLRAKLLLAESQPDNAVNDLSRANMLDPLNNERLMVLGRGLLDVERNKEAESVLENAVKAMPDSKEAKVQLGRALVASGRHEEAIERLTDVIRADAQNAAAFRLRGEARLGLKRLREGVNDLEAALRLGGKDWRVRVLLARAYLLQGDAAKAVDHASVAVELSGSREPGALAVLAQAYAASGDNVRATNWMRKAVRLRPDSETYRGLFLQYQESVR